MPLNLRILHFTQPFARYRSLEHAARISSLNQECATAIFRKCNESKSNLKYVVLGSSVGATIQDSSTMPTFQRQHCYVKGSVSGEAEPVAAVPIARSQLFDMDAEAAEMLKFDPSSCDKYWVQ